MQDNPMTALAEKYADTERYPRMIGTGGTPDYLIIGKRPELNLQLGLKVLIGVGGNSEEAKSILVGFRLRSAVIPGFTPEAEVHSLVEGETDKPQVVQGQPAEGWAFPWERNGYSATGHRAALDRLIALNRTLSDASFVYEDLEQIRFYGKVMNFLREHLPVEQWAVTEDELIEYIKVSLYEPLTAMQAATDPVKELELLEHNWQTKQEQFAQYETAYKEKKAELEAKIAAAAEGGEPAYQPKAHYSDELVTAEAVSVSMLKGAKPKLAVVAGTDTEQDEAVDQSDLVEAAGGDSGLSVGGDDD